MRVPRVGPPRQVLQAAFAALDAAGLDLQAHSSVVATDPLGPSPRRYANAAVVVETPLDPPALLALLQGVERAFGRRRRGGKWGARPLDLDIVLWSGGIWASAGLTIPHPAYRRRSFVLGPAAAIAPAWRDPVTGSTLRHLLARLTRHPPLRR